MRVSNDQFEEWCRNTGTVHIKSGGVAEPGERIEANISSDVGVLDLTEAHIEDGVSVWMRKRRGNDCKEK